MKDELIQWCRRLIACPSITGEGTRAIAELCARAMLAPAGIESRLIPSRAEGEAQVNLVATIKGEDSSLAPIVLNTHLDTVPPGDKSLWTECAGDPFSAPIKNDRIYGLGAADTKLDFVAKASALIDNRHPRRDVWLIATFGEERGMVGARELAGSAMLPRGAMAFIGEPSALEVVTAHKGLIAFHLVLRFDPVKLDQPATATRALFLGRSAHSSTPALGVNAIVAALDALTLHRKPILASIGGGDAVNKVPARCELVLIDEALANLSAAKPERIDRLVHSLIPDGAISMLRAFIAYLTDFANSKGPVEPDYSQPTLTCNPGVIRSTEDSLTLEFELRPPPSMAIDMVRAGVNQAFNKIADHAAGVTASLTERRANPGFRSPANSEAVAHAIAALTKAGLPVRTAVKTGCTEAGIYAAAGLHPVVFGPGQSAGVIHAPNEYNLIAQVEGAVRFYSAIVDL
ncbi:MAG: M20/M25/M40 family metallo-hydrolase [Candidatus Binataceae bacterium]|nr:M20/M25/M40 family metallo-hydrolase [Candidatus Binataceae bacterium]